MIREERRKAQGVVRYLFLVKGKSGFQRGEQGGLWLFRLHQGNSSAHEFLK